MEFSGRLVWKAPKKTGVSKKGTDWQSIDFVLEEQNTQYPQKGVFNCFGDKVELIEKSAVGTLISVKYGLQANEWKDTYFGKNAVWEIEVSGSQPAPLQANNNPNILPAENASIDETDSDGLPF